MNKTANNLGFDLASELKKIAWFLPNQGPIKDFIHQNILLAYLDMPFEEALVAAGNQYKARAYMDLAYYRQCFNVGKVDPLVLGDALDHFLPPKLAGDRELVYHALFAYQEIKNEQALYYLARAAGAHEQKVAETLGLIHAAEKQPGGQPPSIADLIVRQVGADFDHQVHQLLFRCLGSYVDQGVSLWPHLDQWPNFLTAISQEAKQSLLPLAPFVNNHDLSAWLSLPPEEAVPQLLKKLLADPELYTPYLEETLFAHPGWSGMVKMLVLRPDTLSRPCDIDLAQMLAVKLALQWQYIQHSRKPFTAISKAELARVKTEASKQFSPNCLSVAYLVLSMPDHLHAPSPGFFELMNLVFLQRVWHRAFEQSHYQKMFSLFSAKRSTEPSKPTTKTYQVIFCVDDRECRVRRFLEEEDPGIETFGTAGFFGIDCYFQPQNNVVQKMCPGNLTPTHIVKEQPHPEARHPGRANLIELATFMSRHGANSTIWGLVSAYTIGHLSLFSLLVSMLHPVKWFKSKRIIPGAGLGEILFEQQAQETRDDGLVVGYTHQEMADRVFSTLNSMGLKGFSRLVFLIGHGSSSVNNPHFSAYDCQACSGRPGAVNARIFAAMANLKPVRALVKEKGMSIPDDTIFVGGFHDTCTDQVEFFELDNLGPDDKVLFDRFIVRLTSVLGRNAQERCRRFSLVPANISGRQALREVEHRAHALFEPRPELGHALNSLAVVGRRRCTYNLNLDGRSFLQTYDPFHDPSGEILNGILSAVVPVCGHINLDYYFSRLDPAIYGSGTKLSHNVCSLIGVGNGLDDDLRTGLPIQMTELHEPIRLLIIIEQRPEIILSVISNNAGIFPWVKNSWVRVAAMDPDANNLSLFHPSSNSFLSL